jgi:D-tyrosyl-tRNA(Tyr) deacylase
MKVIIQRASYGKVVVNSQPIARIEEGLVVLVGLGKGDSEEVLSKMRDKIVNLRIFSDQKGHFQHSLLDIKGGLLLVPQFTLFADCSKGRRPDFGQAMEPKQASKMFDRFVELCRETGLKVETGEFGALMEVSLLNHGPVTISLEEE